MKKLRGPFAFLLCIILVAGALPLFTGAEEELSVMLVNCDTYVYAGGYYDMYASSNIEGCKYQWVARYGSDGSFVALSDNERYSGTATDHFRFLTADGYAYGTGWNEIRFGCMVTAPDGRVRITQTLGMDIATRDQLMTAINSKKLTIEDFYISQFLPVSEADGVAYYTIPAGEKISFYGVHGDPGTQFDQSEVTFNIDIFVTQNGKTTKLQQKGEKTRIYTIGDGAVTARAELNVYQNGEKLTTLDTKRIVVNSVSPAWFWEGVAKYDCSLLAERYNESQKLTGIAKGQRVCVIADFGTWCEVAANGFIGYLPSSAMTIYDTIGEVGIHIQEPNYGVPVDMNVTFDSEDYGLYDIDPVSWFDETADRFLEKGEQFVYGHTYSLSVWIKAKNGRNFRLTQSGQPDVKATINGVEVTVCVAYEQYPGEVIELSMGFNHLHDPKKVTQVNPTCTEDGKLTHYLCICGADFVDNRSLERITDPNWGIIPARGHRESEWRVDSNGEHYKFCLRRECGETIYYTVGAHTGGTADCHNKAVCEVCGYQYGELGGHVWSEGWEYRGADGHARKCTVLVCGEKSEILPHTPGPAATATEPQVCLDCGYVLEYSKEQNPFTDVPDNSWFTEAALWCNAKGYITGTSATTFSPNTPLNRAMFVQILARVELGTALDDVVYNGAFTDVTANDWYARAVQWASDNGVTEGTGGGKFSPKAHVTRQQIATFLLAYARFKGYDVSASVPLDGYADAGSISGWALDAMRWAVAEGLITGTSADTLSPKKEATRAQAAVIFKNFVETFAGK